MQFVKNIYDNRVKIVVHLNEQHRYLISTKNLFLNLDSHFTKTDKYISSI